MYQTNSNQPWYGYSARDHDNIVQKYNNVCQLVHELTEVIKLLELKIIAIEKHQEPEKIKFPKRCRYLNVGYCKKGSDCLYSHPQETCQEYLESGSCASFRSCSKRHPKECRYWKRHHCFRGNECMFLHQAVLNTVEGNLSSIDASEKRENSTIEVNDQKIDKDVIVDDKEESVETVFVEDDDESVETVRVEEEEKSVKVVTLEEIMNFYENDLNIDSDGNFMNIGEIDPMKYQTNSQTNLRLQRSTRKSKKSTSTNNL